MKASMRYLLIKKFEFCNLTYCQRKYFATKSKTSTTSRIAFDRFNKRLQKCHAAASPDVFVYEYLKEKVCFLCV